MYSQGYICIQLCMPALQVHGLCKEWLISKMQDKPQHQITASVRSSKCLESHLIVEKQVILGA